MLLNGEYLYKCDKGGYVIEVVKNGGANLSLLRLGFCDFFLVIWAFLLGDW